MKLVAPYIEDLKPYVPGKPVEALRRERGITGAIHKLASNENPLGPSPLALEAASRALLEGHLYPDGAQYELRARLSEHVGVSLDRIVAGNGSNELIDLVIRAFARAGDHCVVSQYAFAVYKICMQIHGVTWTEVPMRDPLTHDLLAMAEAVRPETRIVWLANPNNPTGTHNGREELVSFLNRLKARGLSPIVVADEAYVECVTAGDFPDTVALQEEYERLVTLRTFSKAYGLAGFRVGYSVTSEEIAGHLHKIRAPFNVSRIAQIAAQASLDDQDHLQRSMAVVHEGLVQVRELLTDQEGLELITSQTNFILCRLSLKPAREVYDKMLDHGVIVRPMGGFGLHDSLRVTIGRPEQNARMAEVFKQVLAEPC